MGNTKKWLIYSLIFILTLITLTACKANDINENTDLTDEPINSDFSEANQTDNNTEEIEDSQKLIKTLDEKHARYNFAYKRSTLSIRKEIFDEYLTDRHIQKFFDIAEIMYDKLAYLFPEDLRVRFENPPPEIIAYHFVPEEWGSEPDLYDDYSHFSSISGAWSNPQTKETFYTGERIRFLENIDIAFPAVVGHEVGHLFTWLPQYVWDLQQFAYFAMFYLASEFPMMDGVGTIITPDYWKSWDNVPQWVKFYDLSEKYGYDIIRDTFEEMMTLYNSDHDLFMKICNDPEAMEARFELFKQVLSQKTGDDIDYYFDH